MGHLCVLLLLLACPAVKSANISKKQVFGPTFIHEPPEHVLFSNTTGSVISCSGQGTPQPTISWHRYDGSPAISIAGLRQLRHDGSLVFFPFEASQYRQDVHATIYRCLLSNVVGTVRSRDVHVKAVVLQTFSAHVSDHFVIRGNTAVIRCLYTASVKNYVKITLWMRDDGVTIGSPGLIGEKYIILPSGELLIRNINPADAVRGYKCQLQHQLTSQSKLSSNAGKIIVREPHSPLAPTITETKSVLRIAEGEKIYIPCISQSYPQSTYRWMKKDGIRLLPIQTSGQRILHRNEILIIQQAVAGDSGIYVCIANNSIGEERAESKLMVSSPLSVQMTPTTQKIDIGKQALFNCRIRGHPIHTISWLKEGYPIVLTSRISLISRDVLQIYPVQREDKGMYQCFISNDLETVQSIAELTIGEDAPTLIYTFKEQTVRPGISISLKCSATGNPLPQVTWMVDNSAIPEAYHSRIGDYVSDDRTVNSYVNISSLNVEDGGIYTCIAQNDVGSRSYSAKLNIYGPLYIKPMTNFTALNGQDLIISCPVSGYPIEKIYWERDGRTLPHNHRQKTFNNGTLVIQEVQGKNDGGRYTCIAEDNKGRSARRDVTLTIMAPPVVEPFFFPADLVEGSRASVACVVSAGDLPIQISWLKDGQHLSKDLRATISIANEFTSLLSISSVAQHHSGNYTCIASNPAAYSNFTAIMVVRVPPKWSKEPRDTSVVMGQPVLFDCQARGFPEPVIRWKKSGEGKSSTDFQVIISSQNIQILENGSLSIKESAKKDEGNYMCQANNDVSSGLSTVVKLTVHVPAYFQQKFHTKTVRRGDAETLTCEAFGEKPIAVTWSRDRHNFNPEFEPRYVSEEETQANSIIFSIRIPSISRRDSALFTCTAENAYGKDDTNFQIVVQEPPDKVSSISVSMKSSRTIAISWSSPYSGNSPVSKYILEYKKTSDSWASPSVVEIDGNDNAYTLQGLLPQTSYHLRLIAENTLGKSEPSDTITVITEAEAPGGAPRNVRVIATSSRTLQVQWKPPAKEDQHGSVEGYYVGYKTKGLNEHYAYKTLEATAGDNQECELSNLKRDTTYSIIVQAFNNKGTGPQSEEVLAQTLEYDPPSTPKLTLISSTSTSIHLTWEQVNSESNPVSGYIIFHKSETKDWEEIQLPDDRNSYTFRALRCGMRYQFYLVAFNKAGRGQPSDVISAKTDGTAPISPDKKSFLTINVTSVTLHLVSWKSGGCPINFFIIQYKPRVQKEWILLSNNVLLEQRVVVITDLTPATWYVLLMTAHNDAGSTEAEFIFATLTITGATVPPLSSQTDKNREFYQQLKIIIPVVCTTIVLVLIATVTCVILMRRCQVSAAAPLQQEEQRPEADLPKPTDTVPLSVWEKRQARLDHSREQLYFPSPYATSRISMYSADGDPEPAPQSGWRGEHTYDVPFLPRQTNGLEFIGQDSRREHTCAYLQQDLQIPELLQSTISCYKDPSTDLYSRRPGVMKISHNTRCYDENHEQDSAFSDPEGSEVELSETECDMHFRLYHTHHIGR